MSIEQINNTTGTVQYLHHDQQGSTRLITGSTGKVEGKCSYSAYGTPTCEGSATTPLGWDAQYTSSDTGLIYLRNRVYDPSTAQFLTVDPLVSRTLAPYSYAGDDPINEQDRTGLSEETVDCYPWGCFSSPGGSGGSGGEVVGEVIAKNWHEFEGGAEKIGEEVGNIWNEITSGGGASRNPAQDKKLTEREIEELEGAGIHPHELKPGGSSEDLYRDREGNIYVKPKGGAGPGEPTGINLRKPPC